MNEIKAYEYAGRLFRTKNSVLLYEMENIIMSVNNYGIIFDTDKVYKNRAILIELLGELE